jgi:hypothetical protein
MEHFEVRNTSLIAIRRYLGFFIVITSFFLFYLYINSSKVAYLIAFVLFLILGIYQVTNGLGMERSWFRTGSDFIIIKWMNMIIPVHIHNSRIAKICLGKSQILIYRKAGSPLKLNLGWLELNQKSEVCQFLIKYSEKNNLVLTKEGRGIWHQLTNKKRDM